MSDLQYTVRALSALRKKSLMINIGNEYLSEDIFLIKFGKDIAKNVEQLKDDIVSLRKEFPGKLKSEIETDKILDKLYTTAQTMVNPGQEVREKCSSGELGRTLESDIRSITEAVHLIRKQVHGADARYTKKDSVANVFDRISNTGRSIGDALFLGLKILLCLIIIAVLAFLYLFFTMEKDGGYLKEIKESQAKISEQKEIITELDKKKEEISKKVEALETDDMKRERKITVLDLEVDIHKINLDQKNAEAEIAALEKKIINNQKEIERIKKIPFLKRLLRR